MTFKATVTAAPVFAATAFSANVAAANHGHGHGKHHCAAGYYLAYVHGKAVCVKHKKHHGKWGYGKWGHGH